SNTILFSGDTLFAGSIGRSDFPLGSYGDLMDSLKNKIMALPGNPAVYPGHGPSSYLDLERRTNPFLVP
ncbi:MAG: MBL fold metallo-hydrolase, partial [Firmicutes bacterium]|nr:MBL fold metallo-hydrolase [Bacillota bacterium]